MRSVRLWEYVTLTTSDRNPIEVKMNIFELLFLNWTLSTVRRGVSYCAVSEAILIYSLDIQHSSKVTRTLVTAIRAEMSPIFGSWLTLRVRSQGRQL